jgi:hypothetical protein
MHFKVLKEMIDSSSQLTANPVASALAVDTFLNGTTSNSWTVITRAGSSNPALTAGTGARATVPANGIPGFAPGTPDSAGAGALRLTDATANQGAAVIYNTAITAGSGLNITFDFFSYGGTGDTANQSGLTTGGDGFSFFLIDGATTTPAVGAFGGSLGYAQRVVSGESADGLAGGYVGIGFDEFGNFSTNTEGKGGTSADPTPNSVTVRGKGSGTTGYNLLTSVSAGGSLSNIDAGATRANSKRGANIDISAAGKLTVKVDINGDGVFSTSETVISNLDLVAANGALPTNFKFGFAASTGGATNIHEIRNLKVDISTTGIKPDLLWRNTTSTPDQTYIWFIDDTTSPTFVGGGEITNSSGAIIRPGKDWQVKATGDFGGSSKTDIVWRNKVTDETALWLMDGTTLTTPLYLLPAVKPGATWDVVGVGQFKGAAGPLSIVWQDSATGEAALWEWDATNKVINTTSGGTNYVQSNGARLKPGTAWKVEGVGDYDGDGISDILWRNGTTVATWLMGGTTGTTLVTPYTFATPLATGFKAVGSAKFNADGTTDILYRDDAADRTIIWTIAKSGATLTPTQLEFAIKPGTGWRIQGVADFNADGKTDIVWRNTATTGNGPLNAAIWALDGVGATLLPGVSDYIKTSAGVALAPSAAWNVVGTGEFGPV